MNAYSIATAIMLALACLSILGYITCCGISLGAKRDNPDKATIFNTFPTEVPSLVGGRGGVILRYLGAFAGTLAGLAMALLFGGMIVPEYTEGIPVTLASIFVLLFSLGAAVCFVISTLVPLDRIKAALISWVVCIFLIAGTGLFSMVIEGVYEMVNMNMEVRYAAAALSGVLLILFLNPKLKNWANMEKTEVNGATIWLRPKVNWMAVNLWVGYAVLALDLLLFAIGVLIYQPVAM